MKKRNYFPFIVLILVSLLLDWYVFQGIKTLTSGMQSGRETIYTAWWLASGGILFLFLYLLSRVFPTRQFTLLFNIAFNAFLTLFVTRLVFIIPLLGEDIYRLLSAGWNLLSQGQPLLPSRQVWVSQASLVVAAVPFFSFLFGITFGKYHYKVRRTQLWFEDLPDEFDNFSIVHISDIHAGSFDNPEAVKRGVELINAQKPDLFVFTGDLVNNKAGEIVPYIDIFKQVKAPYGRFSVLGNHDYGDYISWPSAEKKWRNLNLLKQYHAELGYRLLLDEHVRIKKGSRYILLLGVENWGKGFAQHGNLKKALQNINQDDFIILLSHDPSHWEEQVKRNPVHIHLTLSGHTHGMQFGIEIGRFKWSPVKYRYPNWAGLAHENGRYLYVNRGFGFIGFAGRVGIWPEITVIELRKGKGVQEQNKLPEDSNI